MLMEMPPKYAVSQVIGSAKGKCAIHIARSFGQRRRNARGQSFWARSYSVSSVGLDEAVIRKYTTGHEGEDRSQDQLSFDGT